MDTNRLNALLSHFPDLTILVVGDFFLDKYLIIEHALGEVSLETGLEAHQVVEVRCQPGAAGTVTNNLRALGVNVLAAGIVGDDGEGFELLRALDANGVDVDALVIRPDRFTPTYTKPMLLEPDGRAAELNRLDIKNRSPLPADAEDALIVHLRGLLPRVHGVIIADQVQEADCGAITERVRDELAALARAYPTVAFLADSRARSA
jgi:bifunctional ADP-heptose synthase (sugar kinase/adenylyltransferase)